MEIIQIIALALVATFIIVFLKQLNAHTHALLISVIVGISVFIAIIGHLKYVVDVIQDLATKANVNPLYLGTMLKIIGIAYLAEFGAQVCRDAGESNIAGRIEFAAKIIVIVLAMPIVVAVLQAIIRLLP